VYGVHRTVRRVVYGVYKRLGESWRVPIGLVVLSLVPALAGAARLGELASGAAVTEENRRFFDMPLPVVLHIVGALVFSLVGVLQFAPSLRRRAPRWHRAAGRAVVLAGLVVAVTGVWMTHAYDLPPADGALLAFFRDVFGIGMAVSLVLGVVAARNGRIRQHRAWMSRAYAIGLGAGTQVFTHIPWFVVFGQPTELPRAFLMLAGWVINLAVAERALRQKRPAARIPVGSSLAPA
jgi:uncharacterized membrane protein